MLRCGARRAPEVRVTTDRKIDRWRADGERIRILDVSMHTCVHTCMYVSSARCSIIAAPHPPAAHRARNHVAPICVFSQLRLRRRARAAAARRVRPGGVRAGGRVVVVSNPIPGGSPLRFCVLFVSGWPTRLLCVCVFVCLCAAAALRRAYGVRAATVRRSQRWPPPLARSRTGIHTHARTRTHRDTRAHAHIHAQGYTPTRTRCALAGACVPPARRCMCVFLCALCVC
jgi:hypothetical protein